MAESIPAQAGKKLRRDQKSPFGVFLVVFSAYIYDTILVLKHSKKNMKTIKQTLNALGFSEYEINIYIASLRTGPRTALQLAEITDIPRLSAHAAIDSLLRRGVMSSVDRGEEKYFAAEHPKAVVSYLHRSLDEKKEILSEFENNLFKLEAQMSDEKPTMKFFQGKDGLMAMQRDFLDSGVKEAVMFYPFTDVAKVFTDQERSSVGGERREKGIRIKVICTNEDADSGARHNAKTDELTEKKEIPFEKFPLSSDITIYGDRVMMVSLRGTLNGVIVESASIAESLRSIFKLAYEAADKYGN